MPPAPERRDAILDAARTLFLRQGLRATSMEAIARAAGVAKPTLYAYFAHKDRVFEALVESTLAEWRRLIFPILEANGGVVGRINFALVEKHRLVLTLVSASPHAAEFYAAHDGPATRLFTQFEQDFAAAIEAEMRAAGITRAKFLTQVLLAASAGIGRRATAAGELGPALRLLTERLLSPELP